MNSSIDTILLVDDDREIRDLLQQYLQANGMRPLLAANGAEMRQRLKEYRADLIVLDLMLPGEDGLSLCRWLREKTQLPVIMLTALGSTTDRIVGLEVGADDYLIKPFGMRELVARCRALLRRSQTSSLAGKVLEHANLRLYPEECRVMRNGEEVNLSPKE